MISLMIDGPNNQEIISFQEDPQSIILIHPCEEAALYGSYQNVDDLPEHVWTNLYRRLPSHPAFEQLLNLYEVEALYVWASRRYRR